MKPEPVKTETDKSTVTDELIKDWKNKNPGKEVLVVNSLNEIDFKNVKNSFIVIKHIS